MPSKSVKKKPFLKKALRFLIILLIVALIAYAAVYILSEKGIITPPRWLFQDRPEIPSSENAAEVHFIDVGQGDCSLIISDDGSTMLIDCGEEEYSADVLGYLDKLGITRLDCVLATHPHSDHIGGMADIISSEIEIGRFILPKIPDEFIPASYTYEKMLNALIDKGCEVTLAKSESFGLGSGTVEISVVDYNGENLNNYSPIVKFKFGERSFIFSGDAEAEIETAAVLAGLDLKADVYKVGHHGSTTSSNPLWVAAIDPLYCVIECGAGNSYGHPHSEVVELLHDYTDYILRTDVNGTVVLITDGKDIGFAVSE